MPVKNTITLPDITYHTATGKFSFLLPMEICDSLLIFPENKNGIILCHRNRQMLEEFGQYIFRQKH